MEFAYVFKKAWKRQFWVSSFCPIQTSSGMKLHFYLNFISVFYLDLWDPKHSNVEHAICDKTKKIIADEVEIQTNNTE